MFLILDKYIISNIYLYAELFVYMLFAIILCSFILGLTYYLTKNVKRDYSIEKNSAYECGFNTFYNFEDSEEIINVRFFLMCILFLVFDLEICFLAPWAVTYNFSTFIPMMVFLFILTVGFAYEWQKGALDWH